MSTKGSAAGATIGTVVTSAAEVVEVGTIKLLVSASVFEGAVATISVQVVSASAMTDSFSTKRVALVVKRG